MGAKNMPEDGKPEHALPYTPLGLEALLSMMKWIEGLPVFLFLGIIQCAVLLWLYPKTLGWQGGLLQQHEQKILEIVAAKGE